MGHGFIHRGSETPVGDCYKAGFGKLEDG